MASIRETQVEIEIGDWEIFVEDLRTGTFAATHGDAHMGGEIGDAGLCGDWGDWTRVEAPVRRQIVKAVQAAMAAWQDDGCVEQEAIAAWHRAARYTRFFADDGHATVAIDAVTAEDAAREYVAMGDWAEVDYTQRIQVHVWTDGGNIGDADTYEIEVPPTVVEQPKTCGCQCSCAATATTTDEAENDVCEQCAHYYLDADGQPVCSRVQDERACAHCSSVIEWGPIQTRQGAPDWREGDCACQSWRQEDRGGWGLTPVAGRS